MIKTDKSTVLGNTCHLTSSIRIALAAMCVSVLVVPQVFAQDDVLEEVIVTGTRQLIQDTISIKRDNVMVVDGLSAADIGDLPALSIGEALESLTGVASHRENGGATEISIRGLGPFLSATTFNGREATNGSGDRSVNFSQFPSEMMSKLVVYKTQDAHLIEGGVAGVIALETLKPLDYGKRRFQFDVKGNYNPDQQDINAQLQNDWGWRGTLSYVDAWDFDNGARLGISLGYQKSDISQPEAEIRSSSPTGSSLWACINEPGETNEGFFRSKSGDCEDQVSGSKNQGYNTDINPETGLAYSDGQAFGWAPSSRGYRQNDTSDERDAFFGALQWQPNEDWNINLDFQKSERTQAELRHDFNVGNQKRATAGVTGPALVTTPNGAITNWLGGTVIESNSEAYSRVEEYTGGGIKADWNATDTLLLSVDISSSKTTRIEEQVSVRMQSDKKDIFDEETPGGYQPTVHWDLQTGIPQFMLEDFDVTDPTLYSDRYRARVDSDVDRTNEIQAARIDFDQDVEWGSINGIQGGLRYSKLEYLNLAGTRNDEELKRGSDEANAAIARINETCRIAFPEDGFLSSEATGDLITVIDGDTGEEISGTGNSWATFDNACVSQAVFDYFGADFVYPDQTRESGGTTDVTETTMAGYLMATFATEWGSKAVNGNFGVRYVSTDVKSLGWRDEYVIVSDSDGFLSMEETGATEQVQAKHSYTEWLPSVNIVMDLTDETLLRGALYRGMSRADPGDLGYNRSFALSGSDDITDPDELIDTVNGSGNPATDPLMSWNADAAIEWYPNEDTILTLGLYYKKFTGGFEQVRQLETFVVDGVEIQAPFTTSQTSKDTSSLYGIEITAAHSLSYLDNWFMQGFGAKIGLNLGNSNFEFEDSNYGDVYLREEDGTLVQQTIGIIAPANVPGFSDTVFSGNVYWGKGNFDSSLIYKYRSEYFQPYTSNGTRIRYVGDVGVWEMRLSYQITKNLRISAEGINLFNEPKQTYYYTDDNFGERNVYGPRYFLGLRGKF